MNRSRILAALFLLTAASPAAQAQTPKKPAPPAPAHADLLQGARAYAAALRAAPVGKPTQTATVSASTRGPAVLGDPHSIDLVFVPGIVQGPAR